MSTTFVSLQRLSLFKSLQDALNARTYLGINDTAVAAQKLATAVNIDGVAFDGSQAIELPTKIVQIYSQTDTNTGNVSYFEDSGFSIPISTFDISKLYVDMTTNEIKFFNGTDLVSSQIHGIDSYTIDGMREANFGKIISRYRYIPDEMNNELFANLRVFVDKNDDFWFIGSEVASLMGYSDTDKAIRVHVPSAYKITRKVYGSGQERDMIMINEIGLYALVMKSKLPQVHQFQDWVYRVIMNIRECGGYINANLR